jgi:predicted nucleic acid-binding protein
MTTAIDSNVLIDLIGPANEFSDEAVAALDRARAKGALMICPMVVAEIASYFASADQLRSTLREMSIEVVDFGIPDLHGAGAAYVAYRKRSSKHKPRMLADFLVGSHALHHADSLLTRDRGYYRTYFPRLKLIDLEKLR